MIKSRTFNAEAVRSIVSRGLISPADVHRHGVRGRDLSQSNGVVLVEAGNGPSFVVKDLSNCDGSRQGSARSEVDLYRAAETDTRLRALVPKLHGFDEARKLLILQGLHTSRRMDRLSGGWSVFSEEIAAWLGRALGEWHRAARSVSGLGAADPWLFHISGPTRLPALDALPHLREMTERVLDDPALIDVLERTRNRWQDLTVIHGDVRFSNVMVQSSPPAVRFVDWEMSGRGDPAWDVAGAIQEYFSLGHTSDPMGELDTARRIDSFLEAYREASGCNMIWGDLAPFVSSRLVLRALQLISWDADSRELADLHLDMARTLERVLHTGSRARSLATVS